MRKDYEKYKNISLSIIIKRDLMRLKMTQKSLAARIDMSYGYLNHLINSSCKFPLDSERKIERILGYEKSFIKKIREYQDASKKETEVNKKMYEGKSIPSIRRCVFWDINPQSLDWIRHRKFIIKRVNRYGNAQEKQSVTSFYNL